MAARKTDYQARKDAVLGIVVNEYIKAVNPVSSSQIAHDYLVDLSPATIRNILAELEHEGYLTHPHTSAGRVPTQEGYRYYVDNLMNEIQLLEDEKSRIRKAYEQEVRDLERLMEKTSEVISDLTQCTSIISIDGQQDRLYCRGTSYIVEYSDYHNLNRIREILQALEKKEHILAILNQEIAKRTRIYIGHEMVYGEMEDCSLAVSRFHSAHGPSGRIAVLGPTRMDYQRVVSTLDYLSQVISEIV